MGFFEKMKDSISFAGAGVSQKVSYTADTVKLNNQIRNNEKEIDKLVHRVGLKCVQMHLNDTDSEYEELFALIRHFQELNKLHQAEIQRLAEDLEMQEQIRQKELRNRRAQREQEQKEKEECIQEQIRRMEEKQQEEIDGRAEQKRQQEDPNQLDGIGAPFPSDSAEGKQPEEEQPKEQQPEEEQPKEQ